GRGIEDLQLVGEDLDLAALETRVDGSLGAPAHHARDSQHEFMAHAVGGGEGLRTIGVADDLHESLAIAQVDEDHPAVVAPAMGPAEEGDGLPEETGVGEAAVFGAHSISSAAPP